MDTEHLLIDAKNMLYRAAYVAKGDQRFEKSGHHCFNIVLHFLTSYYEKFRPKNVHVFWDSRRELTWRRDISPEYKSNRGQKDPDITEVISDLTEISIKIFKHMGIRQYYQDKMEADDLIYAFCRINQKDPIVIVSSDSDLKQIPFNFSNVNVHHPLSKNRRLIEEVPHSDPVIHKCLSGDKSDNIPGYHLVGKVRAKMLTEDARARSAFFKSEKAKVKLSGAQVVVGSSRFLNNLKLIDLSLCPKLLNNLEYIMGKQFREVQFDLDKIRDLISKYKLRGVTADISRYIIPFKKLIEDPNG